MEGKTNSLVYFYYVACVIKQLQNVVKAMLRQNLFHIWMTQILLTISASYKKLYNIYKKQKTRQTKTNNVGLAARKVCLKIQKTKTTTMRVNTTRPEYISLGKEALEDVEKMCYLRSIVHKKKDYNKNVITKIRKT